eukprot:6997443-Prymnesium_polylepis.1
MARGYGTRPPIGITALPLSWERTSRPKVARFVGGLPFVLVCLVAYCLWCAVRRYRALRALC